MLSVLITTTFSPFVSSASLAIRLPRQPPAAPFFFHHPPPPSPPFLLPRSQRSVLTVRRHPSGLSSVAPGRLARTAWDSAHFPALIIPGCSAGTSPCHSGLRRPLFHLLLFSLLLCRPLSVPPSIRAIIALPPIPPDPSTSCSPTQYRSAFMTSAYA